MLYIDIDGVLADSDGYVASLEPRSMSDTHILFKTLAKNYETVFINSKPLIDLKLLENIGEFKLLSALPNRSNIDSFYEDSTQVDKVFSTYIENKKAWVKKYIGDCELIITNTAAEKSKYCKSSKDVLIDDSDKNRKKWVAAGGIAFKSVDDYIENHDPDAATQPILAKKDLW